MQKPCTVLHYLQWHSAMMVPWITDNLSSLIPSNLYELEARAHFTVLRGSSTIHISFTIVENTITCLKFFNC